MVWLRQQFVSVWLNIGFRQAELEAIKTPGLVELAQIGLNWGSSTLLALAVATS
jgi:hypothetical protein